MFHWFNAENYMIKQLVELHKEVKDVDFGEFCKLVAVYYGLMPETCCSKLQGNSLYKLGMFTNKFKELMKKYALMDKQTTSTSLAKTDSKPRNISNIDYLKEFALLAEVPFRITTDTGRAYTVRAYSKEAAKALVEFMKHRNYDIAINATKLYYKSKLYHKTLTNFILQGDLENYYDEIIAQAKNNKLPEFIKTQVSGRRSNEIEL